MKKLLALFLILPIFISAEEDNIELLCNYIEGTKETHANKSMTIHFTDEPITIDVSKDKKTSKINGDNWEYFTETKPLIISISTRIIYIEDTISDIGSVMSFYEYIEIDRQTGKLIVRNFTKQNDDDTDESYPLAFSKEYECRSLKVIF